MAFKDKEKEKAYHREYAKAHREEYRVYGAKRRMLVKMTTLIHYSTKEYPICSVCGELDIRVLQLDHIFGGGRKQRKQLGLTGAGWQFYEVLQKEGYPEGYQVLCANCNIKKQYELNAQMPSMAEEEF